MRPQVKILLSLLAVAVLPSLLCAQGQYLFNTGTGLRKIATVAHDTTSDGGLIMLVKESVGNNYIIKFDKKNNILWSNKLTSDKSSEFTTLNLTSISALPDDEIILCGSVIYGNDIDMALVCLDHAGKIKWTRRYSSPQNEAISAVKVQGSSIHVGGYAIIPLSYGLINHVFYARFSLEGYIEVLTLRPSTDGGVKLIAVSETTGNVYLNAGNKIIALDEKGKSLSTFSISSLIPQNSYATSFESVGSQMFLGGYMGSTDNTNKRSIFLIQWESKPSYWSLSPTIHNIKPDSAGHTFQEASAYDMTVVGESIYLTGQLDTGAFSIPHLFQCKLNISPALKIEWFKGYGYTDYPLASSICFKRSNMVSAVGKTKSLSQNNGVYMVETNLTGNSGCKEFNTTMIIESNTFTLYGDNSYSMQGYQFEGKNISLLTEPIDFKQIGTVCDPNPVSGFTLSDTSICIGDSISIIDTSKFANEWYWKFNNRTFKQAEPESFKPQDTGVFTIIQVVSNLSGSDTAYRTYRVNALPKAYAGVDLKVCQGEQITLTPSGGKHYRWSNMTIPDSFINTDPTNSFLADRSTYYYVRVYNENFCEDTDSVYVEVISPVQINKGSDKVICEGEAVTLSAGKNNSYRYHWSTGDTSANITVKEPGIYAVTASNECFSQTASFIVDTIDCRLYWYAPNAFTVNEDELNEGFHLIGHNIEQVEMKIYNRWGERVFAGTGKNPIWNGTFKGRPAPEGLYIYTVVVTGIDKKKQFSKSSLMLLR